MSAGPRDFFSRVKRSFQLARRYLFCESQRLCYAEIELIFTSNRLRLPDKNQHVRLNLCIIFFQSPSPTPCLVELPRGVTAETWSIIIVERCAVRGRKGHCALRQARETDFIAKICTFRHAELSLASLIYLI